MTNSGGIFAGLAFSHCDIIKQKPPERPAEPADFLGCLMRLAHHQESYSLAKVQNELKSRISSAMANINRMMANISLIFSSTLPLPFI